MNDSSAIADSTSRDQEEFCPVIVELPPQADAEQAFLRLASLPRCVFFDSARRDPLLGRYSFVAADPFDYLELPTAASDPLGALASRLNQWRATTIVGLPPFQGGAAGLFSYDLARSLERLPLPLTDEFQTPALAVGLYDVVVAFDHVLGRAWIISQGFPEREPSARRARAQRRATEIQKLLEGSAPASRPVIAAGAIDLVAPHHVVDGASGLSSDFSPAGYLEAIRRAIEYIEAGDIFQVNLAQRLIAPALDDSVSLYLRLRRRNRATFAGYFDLGRSQIVSASPERFLKLSSGEVETRPIKGTRQRTARPEADLFAGDELQDSEKDRAENVMIVDLMRNDLARVCRPDSVRVTQLCRLESYEFVQHLVSAVRGELAAGRGPIDLLRAAFPGGSITGAPKVRAMEIIAELEPTARGPYCGSLGYIGFDGALDSSILIRTIVADGGWWRMGVGGGIVADSIPEREYQETWHKAEGLLRALA